MAYNFVPKKNKTVFFSRVALKEKEAKIFFW